MTAELKLKKETQELADALAKELKIDASGIATLPEDAYEKHLSEGLTVADIKRAHAYNARFLAASALAFGEATTDAMKKDKKLDSTTLQYQGAVGDTFTHSIKRSQEYKGVKRGDAPAEPITKYAVLTTVVEVPGTTTGAGELKKIRSYLSEAAKAVLSK